MVMIRTKRQKIKTSQSIAYTITSNSCTQKKETSDLTERQVSIENDVLELEKVKAEDSILDSPISFAGSRDIKKQLIFKPRKAPGSNKIRNLHVRS